MKKNIVIITISVSILLIVFCLFLAIFRNVNYQSQTYTTSGSPDGSHSHPRYDNAVKSLEDKVEEFQKKLVELERNILQKEKTYQENIENVHKEYESLTKQISSLPTGTVIAYYGNIAPEGWLICDGSILNQNTQPQYSKLIAHLSFLGKGDGKTATLPDLRGVFLRGIDLGKNFDTNRQLGTYQEDNNKRHTHTGNTVQNGNHNHSGVTGASGEHFHTLYYIKDSDDISLDNNGLKTSGNTRPLEKNGYFPSWSHKTSTDGNHLHSFTTLNAGAHSHSFTTDTSGERESVPKNVAVLYIIKY